MSIIPQKNLKKEKKKRYQGGAGTEEKPCEDTVRRGLLQGLRRS